MPTKLQYAAASHYAINNSHSSAEHKCFCLMLLLHSDKYPDVAGVVHTATQGKG